MNELLPTFVGALVTVLIGTFVYATALLGI